MSTIMRLFRIAALSEAVSWLGLLIGMYVKYLGSGTEIGVKIFGPIHGMLFIVYCVAVYLLSQEREWTRKQLIIGLACSIPPLVTLAFERHVVRRSRDEPATSS